MQVFSKVNYTTATARHTVRTYIYTQMTSVRSVYVIL